MLPTALILPDVQLRPRIVVNLADLRLKRRVLNKSIVFLKFPSDFGKKLFGLAKNVRFWQKTVVVWKFLLDFGINRWVLKKSVGLLGATVGFSDEPPTARSWTQKVAAGAGRGKGGAAPPEQVGPAAVISGGG